MSGVTKKENNWKKIAKHALIVLAIIWGVILGINLLFYYITTAAGWVEYTNEKIGLTLEYPAESMLIEEYDWTNIAPEVSRSWMVDIHLTDKYNEEGEEIPLDVFVNNANEYLNLNYSRTDSVYYQQSFKVDEKTSIETEDGGELVYLNGSSKRWTCERYVYEIENAFCVVDVAHITRSKSANRVTDKIFDSIEITEPLEIENEAQSVDGEWVEYTTEEFGITFEYPAGAEVVDHEEHIEMLEAGSIEQIIQINTLTEYNYYGENDNWGVIAVNDGVRLNYCDPAMLGIFPETTDFMNYYGESGYHGNEATLYVESDVSEKEYGNIIVENYNYEEGAKYVPENEYAFDYESLVQEKIFYTLTTEDEEGDTKEEDYILTVWYTDEEGKAIAERVIDSIEPIDSSETYEGYSGDETSNLYKNPLVENSNVCNPTYWKGDNFITYQGASFDTDDGVVKSSSTVQTESGESIDVLFGHNTYGAKNQEEYNAIISEALELYEEVDSTEYGVWYDKYGKSHWSEDSQQLYYDMVEIYIELELNGSSYSVEEYFELNDNIIPSNYPEIPEEDFDNVVQYFCIQIEEFGSYLELTPEAFISIQQLINLGLEIGYYTGIDSDDGILLAFNLAGYDSAYVEGEPCVKFSNPVSSETGRNDYSWVHIGSGEEISTGNYAYPVSEEVTGSLQGEK